jgi:hypothetical protein
VISRSTERLGALRRRGAPEEQSGLHAQHRRASDRAGGAGGQRAERLRAELHRRHPRDGAHHVASGHPREQGVARGHREGLHGPDAEAVEHDPGEGQPSARDRRREGEHRQGREDVEPGEQAARVRALRGGSAEQDQRERRQHRRGLGEAHPARARLELAHHEPGEQHLLHAPGAEPGGDSRGEPAERPRRRLAPLARRRFGERRALAPAQARLFHSSACVGRPSTRRAASTPDASTP